MKNLTESENVYINDQLNDAQIRGLALLKLLYGCEIDIFYVAEVGRVIQENSVVREF
ncbi:hypothetical protein SAMN05192569_10701 [Parageobacillus thermantarcticus]|uniref:Uncharacterized protein n=1 Tax=Parageobacillus thermantarcticus TaxID=186116 RepID=A0A1I0TW90_9BACL|nr:hypothetical protein [Parageobacillus thermantarcticus]SFA56189.1 hypothetical protein SAMN05192569_10701 [Parageobacillus thermantarcticus]